MRILLHFNFKSSYEYSKLYKQFSILKYSYLLNLKYFIKKPMGP